MKDADMRVLLAKVYETGQQHLADLENAAYRSAQHLLDLNHMRLAYLSGLDTSESSRARRLGIEAALKKVGLTLPPEMCPCAGYIGRK